MLRKNITFIYSDSAERSMYIPIMEEAERRGYQVQLTDNMFERCEIGVYCQHINFPQFSKCSLIMLHDIIQAYSNWPDLWRKEPWDKYDIGILPSTQWEENWKHCSQWAYARPRKGMFKIGWPKADVIKKLQENASKEKFFLSHHMNLSRRTILYAPAWENDRKQDDFVRSMQKLNVNILIKQAPFPESKYPQIVKNIKDMYELHKDIPNVTILPPSTNIFEAIAVSDVLVSEESSTMCEAAMMGIPAISVSNWLIPDVTPSRFPKCDYDFVILTMKEELTNCVESILDNYSFHKMKVVEYSKKMFSNIGTSSSMIMDIIDDYIEERPIRYKALVPNPSKRRPFKDECLRLREQFIIELELNYKPNHYWVRTLWRLLRTVKHVIMWPLTFIRRNI